MEFIVPWLVGLFSLLCLGGIFFAAWRKTGIWFNPASLFAMAWVVYLAVPLLVGFGVDFNPAAAIYIVFFVFCFSLSVFGTQWSGVVDQNKFKVILGGIFSNKSLIYFFLLLLVLAVMLHLLDLSAQGFPVSFDALSIGGEYASRRYAGELNENIFQKLALLASFQVVVFGGLVFGGATRRSRQIIVLLLAFIPSALVMLLQSAKGLLFLSAALFIGAWLVTRVFANDFRLPQVPLLPVLLGVLGLFGLVVASFIARFGPDVDILRYYLASYSSGHFFAFSDWFSDRYFGVALFQGYDQSELQVGFYTFMGFFRALGDARPVPLGVYDEFFEIDGVLITNIYTAFRGLIFDFGLFGSLLFAVLAGLIANLSFYFLLCKRFAVIPVVIFIYMVGLIYQSYLVSSLTWVSVPVSAAISVALILLFRMSLRYSIVLGKSRDTEVINL
jgi:oligosaccharide repeat unit polymerase